MAKGRRRQWSFEGRCCRCSTSIFVENHAIFGISNDVMTKSSAIFLLSSRFSIQKNRIKNCETPAEIVETSGAKSKKQSFLDAVNKPLAETQNH
jgi:hypothetical protein